MKYVCNIIFLFIIMKETTNIFTKTIQVELSKDSLITIRTK